jgi:hypothetical protein
VGVSLLLVACSARAQSSTPGRGQLCDVGALIKYDFNGDTRGRSLAPGVFLIRQANIWEDAQGTNRLVHTYGANLNAPSELFSRADFAENLMLPGIVSIECSAAYEHGRAPGISLRGPDIGVGAKVVARGDDALSQQVAFHGGVAASIDDVLDLSMSFSRAMNAPRGKDREGVVAALGSPGLWATYLSTTAELHSRADRVSLFAAFAAYLGDSKFHVVPAGRKVFSLGVKTEFERRRGVRKDR